MKKMIMVILKIKLDNFNNKRKLENKKKKSKRVEFKFLNI